MSYSWSQIIKKKIARDLTIINYFNRGYWAKFKKYTQYYIMKLFHSHMVKLTGVELSNFCCLECPNCPTPITKFHKGFASEETVKLALKYGTIKQPFSFHRHGEPFMHKDFLKYLKMATDMGYKTLVSTNGILLDDEKIKALAKIRPYDMRISLHTKDSVIAFIKMTQYILDHGIEFPYYCGNKLSHNKEDVDRWLDELNASPEIRKYVREISSHSWAGNLENRKKDYSDDLVKRRVKNCYYIKNDYVSLRWDGTIVACCMDSENLTQIGHIKDFFKVRQHKEGYEMCTHCDAGWVNEFEGKEEE